MYTCAYAYVVITSPWHLTCRLVTVSYRYSTALCFHENCQLVVIISASGMTVLLCFCGASGGSTLFTLGNPYIMEIPRCLIICVDMGILVFCTYGAEIPMVAVTHAPSTRPVDSGSVALTSFIRRPCRRLCCMEVKLGVCCHRA